ncbi:hypothetical protein DSO57_1012199 [Entomophthora muscae]|uniref:Uncharacterized protein n=1 Tax=Entomophthora muscae TaxID=34485 RepID=A0ACC2UFN4_9FUNG|nr:hypothetical protein DSO57_1012199 [Entomophthora muscae]
MSVYTKYPWRSLEPTSPPEVADALEENVNSTETKDRCSPPKKKKKAKKIVKPSSNWIWILLSILLLISILVSIACFITRN